MTFDIVTLLLIVSVQLAIFSVVRRIVRRERELCRFNPVRNRWWEFVRDDIARFVQFRITQRTKRREDASGHELQRLLYAGLESVESRETFYIIKDGSILVAIVVILAAFWWYPEEIATIISISAVAIGFYGPRWWVHQRARERQARIERELPFLLQSIALGTEVGWDPIRVMDTLADTLGEEDAAHPLVHELRRAQWFATTGSSWSEGLRTHASRSPSVLVSHIVKTLSGAISSDVRQHEVIEGIARDTHRGYLMKLEGRLAILPVATIVIGCVLLSGFALLLQLPFL